MATRKSSLTPTPAHLPPARFLPPRPAAAKKTRTPAGPHSKALEVAIVARGIADVPACAPIIELARDVAARLDDPKAPKGYRIISQQRAVMKEIERWAGARP
jgi:hypothetical protein